jgi:hypothetical protein
VDKALAIEENGAEFLMALGRAARAEERDDGRIRWAIGNSPSTTTTASYMPT